MCLAVLEFEANEDVTRIDREGRGGDNSATDIHECVKEVTEHGRGLLQSENEGRAFETFVSQVE